MSPELYILALVVALPAGAAASSEPTPVAIPDPAGFASALEACSLATHAGPHPFMKGFVIEHAITGTRDGTCAYSQTMPGGMRMECQLSEAGRAGLAAEFREQAAGRMSGSTSNPPAWTGECEIVGKDGKRTPMGG